MIYCTYNEWHVRNSSCAHATFLFLYISKMIQWIIFDYRDMQKKYSGLFCIVAYAHKAPARFVEHSQKVKRRISLVPWNIPISFWEQSVSES